MEHTGSALMWAIRAVSYLHVIASWPSLLLELSLTVTYLFLSSSSGCSTGRLSIPKAWKRHEHEMAATCSPVLRP